MAAPAVTWIEVFDGDRQRHFYVNTATQESVWKPPPGFPPPLPPTRDTQLDRTWVRGYDVAQGRLFYFNTVTQESRWTAPGATANAVPSAAARAALDSDGRQGGPPSTTPPHRSSIAATSPVDNFSRSLYGADAFSFTAFVPAHRGSGTKALSAAAAGGSVSAPTGGSGSVTPFVSVSLPPSPRVAAAAAALRGYEDLCEEFGLVPSTDSGDDDDGGGGGGDSDPGAAANGAPRAIGSAASGRLLDVARSNGGALRRSPDILFQDAFVLGEAGYPGRDIGEVYTSFDDLSVPRREGDGGSAMSNGRLHSSDGVTSVGIVPIPATGPFSSAGGGVLDPAAGGHGSSDGHAVPAVPVSNEGRVRSPVTHPSPLVARSGSMGRNLAQKADAEGVAREYLAQQFGSWPPRELETHLVLVMHMFEGRGGVSGGEGGGCLP